jgi:ankyrin repeat protein
MLAATNNDFDAVKYFLGKGANVNLRRSDNGATAASLAYDKGYIEMYNYLKENGAVDFTPLQSSDPRVSEAPAPGVPPSSASSAGSTASALDQAAQALSNAFSSPLDSGTYTLTGAVPAKISIAAIAKSGSLFYNRDGRSISGTYSIDGNTMTVRVEGRTFVYTITSKTSFTGHGETWVRTGF